MQIEELVTIKQLQECKLDDIKVYGLIPVGNLEDIYKFDHIVRIVEEPAEKVEVKGVTYTKYEPERTDYTFEDDRPLTDAVPLPKELIEDDLDEACDNIIDKIMPLVSNKHFPIEPQRELTKDDWDDDEVKKMLQDGHSAKFIADYYNMPYQTVYGKIKRAGLM